MAVSKRGTVPLNSAVFDRWQSSKLFLEDFKTSCEIHGLRAGLEIHVDAAKVDVVIKDWKHDSDQWLINRLPDDTVQISHLKKAAILLHWLCKMDPITVVGGLHPDEPVDNIQDGGGPLPVLRTYTDDDKRRFEDGGSEYFSWLFVYSTVEWFEASRVDRQTEYVSRITSDFEHDMIHYLRHGGQNADAIFMMLKGLFLRD